MFSIKAKILALFFAIILFSALFISYISGIVKPLILNKCEADLKIFVQDAINSAISDELDRELFVNLIDFSSTSEGKVTAYSANMLTAAKIRSVLGKKITEINKSLKETELVINSGLITGIPFLYSSGNEIKIRIDGFTYSEFNVSSEFTDAGINQTLYKVYLDIKAVSRIKAPFLNERIITETRIPLSETVIIGDVPDAYTVIIRAHEEDEEDINDFAADIEN
jgi:sporulation protein YunB